MYYQLRRMVFETNSSSVHSLSLCNGSDYKRWSNGELFYEPYGRGFVTLEEVVNSEDFREAGLSQYIKEGFSLFKEMAYAYGELAYGDDYWKIVDERSDELNDVITEKIRDMQIYSIDSFFANTSCETFIESKNIDGVNVVAFGYFGHD